MRRSASEIISNLEMRTARLEGRTANKHSGLKISTGWYTGHPRDRNIDMTFAGMIAEVNSDLESAKDSLKEQRGTSLFLNVDIGSGQLQISWGLDDGSDNHQQGGCWCCLYQVFVATGCESRDYKFCANKLQSILKSNLKASASIEIYPA
jgi:hypothetical protein